MRQFATTVLVACAVILLSLDASACGESLFRVGKGLTYREYTAPFPGNLLIVAKTEGELAMVERLAAAGHHVHVVADPSEIAALMAEEKFDIVMSLYSQHEIVEAQLASDSVNYIPVAQFDNTEEEQAVNAYEQALSTNDSVKTFLKTIHRTLKQKRS